MINDYIETWFDEITARPGKDSGLLREKVRAVTLKIAERLRGCDFQTSLDVGSRAPQDKWVDCVWPGWKISRVTLCRK